MQGELFDFGDGLGAVPAKRHINPDGTLGGWVANTAFVCDKAVIGFNAQVFGTAQVFCDAQVYDNAKVSTRIDNTKQGDTVNE